ncbi:SulP family inorganic anion transporter [Sphingobium algorifonticola]|uniref:SulP family inorganic anion transporter n=1 Tax=Sphingobium algorifonticola TaxID=2008318 RepID=A0A437JD88_9SPHN|nr:SulP family inorganic anion transporter [Sphingobium algorifonticola]RVT43861.1 SulP family inorganic anion transporter [Sphingobium algorifonticola]
MSAQKSLFSTLRADIPASIVVALVALPLCLGVALASGAPLFSGLIAGIVGGLVVGILSKSPLSVSGPAAGLTVIVLSAIENLPTYEAFLLAVVLAGIMQLAFALTRSGVLSEFVPSSVITGMLAAIGLILILKQLPHALGYDGSYEGNFDFFQADGYNTFSAIWYSVSQSFLWGAMLIAIVSLVFLFWWDHARPKEGLLRFVPGPLVVVLIGVLGNLLLGQVAPALAIEKTHLVQVPVAEGFGAFLSFFSFPDFTAITNPRVWTAAATLAIVASLESLLCIKAVDELDPRRRTTDKNWELLAQGGGNIVSGMIGGIPITSVIVRSSANVDAGAESKMSAILHGFWLLLSVLLIPAVLNLIPLSALAAVLIATGYKLTKPKLFVERYKQGWTQFIPFVVTVTAILFTDLLIGIGIGLVVGFVFVIARNFRPAITFIAEDSDCIIRARRNLYFIHKYELQKALNRVPDDCALLIDLSSTNYVDLDNVDIINAFIKGASYRNITVRVRADIAERVSPLINAKETGVRFA